MKGRKREKEDDEDEVMAGNEVKEEEGVEQKDNKLL